jgi:DNA processing protein
LSALAPAERLARLRLARTEGVGPVGFARLLARFGSAEAAVEALDGMGKPLAPRGLAEAEVEAAERIGARHLFAGEAAYPPRIAALADPPPVLLALGDTSLAARPTVALVGARNASAAGRRLAQALADGLGATGVIVASGLARGIDSAAHRGALGTGTIACVAGGPDVAYPPENADLQAMIAEQGLILSELPPGTEPQARHFPRRNRLIAGVAAGVVVIEAAPGSGSLITARLAAEAGREVMAVPGHPADPRSRGGNALIRDGATLVETAADVLAALAPFALAPAPPAQPAPRRAAPTPRPAAAPAPAAPPEGGLLDLLTVEGIALDELVRASGRPANTVQAELADLELEGVVVRLPGGRIAAARLPGASHPANRRAPMAAAGHRSD